MTGYILGVDVGGSKTHALITDSDGQALGFGESGPGNHEVVGYDGLVQSLHIAVDQALQSTGIFKDQIIGAGFGVAGYDWPSERMDTLQAIATLGLKCPVEAVNDTIIGLLAGASQGWGVVVIAGTSNNCRGRDLKGNEGRVTGCGEAFGEYGGATEMVNEAVKNVNYAWIQRGPPTRLSEAFIHQVGARDLSDLLEGLVMGRYSLAADLAPLIFQVAADGDRVAREVISWSGRELGHLATSVIHQLGFEQLQFDVILSGSLYDGGRDLTGPMQETILAAAPGAQLIRLMAPPVVGGIVLGMQQIDLIPERTRLLSSTRELLRVFGG